MEAQLRATRPHSEVLSRGAGMRYGVPGLGETPRGSRDSVGFGTFGIEASQDPVSSSEVSFALARFENLLRNRHCLSYRPSRPPNLPNPAESSPLPRFPSHVLLPGLEPFDLPEPLTTTRRHCTITPMSRFTMNFLSTPSPRLAKKQRPKLISLLCNDSSARLAVPMSIPMQEVFEVHERHIKPPPAALLSVIYCIKMECRYLDISHINRIHICLVCRK